MFRRSSMETKSKSLCGARDCASHRRERFLAWQWMRGGTFRDHDHVGVVVENSGRVGDSPIIGAGAAWTMKWERRARPGKGEENIKISGGHTIVEMMRRGNRPRRRALKRWRASPAITATTRRNSRPSTIFFLRAEQRRRSRRGISLAQSLRGKQHSCTRCMTARRRGSSNANRFFDEINTHG